MAPRTTVAVQTTKRSGNGIILTMNAATATDGDAFLNNGEVLIEIANTGAQLTLTVQTPGTVDGLAVAELTVTVPATTTVHQVVGPFPRQVFNQVGDLVYLDWSRASDVTFAAFQPGS